MNGSGCTAAGEHALLQSAPDRENAIRKRIRQMALIAALVGALWCGYHAWELASRTFVTATVDGLTAEEGKCRRPSGRYQDCLQSKVMVSFTPSGAQSPIQAEVVLHRKGVTLSAGDPILVGYRPDNPKDIELLDLTGLFRTPLGVLLTALFLLGLERLTR